MPTQDTCCTIVPYFKIPSGKLEFFQNLCERFVEKTKSESGVLYYGFSFDGDQAHCREGYTNAAGLLAHLENVGDLLKEMIQMVDLTRLEVHAPDSELAKLREPMAAFQPQFFTLSMASAANMRLAIGILCLAMMIGMPELASAKTPPSADSLIQAAVQTAKSQHKVVLVHFGASWCKWCKQLDEMLQGKDLGPLIASHYVLVHLTVQESDDKKALENPGAAILMGLYGAGDSGVPVFMFFDGAGKMIADSLALPNRGNIGYPGSPEEIQAFSRILNATAPRMTAEERGRIIDYLKKHAPPPEPETNSH